jgi:Arf-GAP/coiled-coil/ANK repeat/PH domain-containing protein
LYIFFNNAPTYHFRTQVLTYALQCREQATYEQAALAEQMQDFRQQMERDNQRSFSDIEASPSGDGIHAVGRSSHKMIEALMQSASNGKVVLSVS